MSKRASAGRKRTWAAPCLLAALALLLSGAAGLASPNAAAAASAPRAVEIPPILSAADRDRYRRIFALQETGKWRAADRMIRKLESRLLLGHVQAQRYLHPTRYRSKYAELAAWLKSYADQPDARRIYKLALRRKPVRARSPRKPPSRTVKAAGLPNIIEYSGYRPARLAERRIIRKVRGMVNRRYLTKATNYISGRKTRRSLGKSGYFLARTMIASGWFFYGNAPRALKMAGETARKTGDLLPYSHWIAGLSAFRLKRHGDAIRHFSAVARNSRLSGWDRAGGAFWAARAAFRGGKPSQVRPFLRIAAAEPRTFYGTLARRWLGDAFPLSWEGPRLTAARLARVAALPAGRRALALTEVGRHVRADRELRLAVPRDDPDLAEALVAVAERKSLAAAAFRAGIVLHGIPDRLRVAALYPVPLWKPRRGFQVDRALIYAFMRQESAFNTRARSHAGARGLMQLMPATAGFISGKRFRGVRRNLLYDPETSVTLGQDYILHLLGDGNVGGNVLLLAAAYNGGPGNLKKWQRVARRARVTDPLMFIESLPARETRIFVERVLSNLWMYRERLGEPAPTLDALAAGKRPVLAASGGWKQAAQDARN